MPNAAIKSASSTPLPATFHATTTPRPAARLLGSSRGSCRTSRLSLAAGAMAAATIASIADKIRFDRFLDWMTVHDGPINSMRGMSAASAAVRESFDSNVYLHERSYTVVAGLPKTMFYPCKTRSVTI